MFLLLFAVFALKSWKMVLSQKDSDTRNNSGPEYFRKEVVKLHEDLDLKALGLDLAPFSVVLTEARDFRRALVVHAENLLAFEIHFFFFVIVGMLECCGWEC